MGMSSKISERLTSYPPSLLLAVSAILSGLIYLTIFTLPFPLTKFYNVIPPVDYTKLTNYSPSGFLRYLFGVGALFGLYIWAIRLSISAGSDPLSPAKASTPKIELGGQRSVVSGRFIFLSSAILALISIFSYPLTAIDLFIYAIRTRGWALYGLQPLTTPPEALPASDPWLGLAGEWVDAASPYGPLWEWLSLGGFHLSGGNFLAHLFVLKIIGALAYLGSIWFIYQILKRSRPDWAIAGTLAFAWNPLVLFESVQNAHNDIVMVFFLLAAIWLFVHITRVWRLNSILLMLLFCLLLAMSILVKFVTVIVVPFFLIVMAMQQPSWTRRVASLALYSSVTTILIIVPMLPFWPGLDNWAVLKASSGAGRSLLALLVLGLREFSGINSAFDLSRNLILLIFALIYLYYLWQTLTGRHLPPVSSAFFVLFWYVLLAVPVFHAWYLLWFLPLAALMLPQQRPLAAAIVFCITALLIIPYFETIRVWYPALLRNHLLGHLIGVPLLIVPPALVLLGWIRPRLKSEV